MEIQIKPLLTLSDDGASCTFVQLGALNCLFDCGSNDDYSIDFEARILK